MAAAAFAAALAPSSERCVGVLFVCGALVDGSDSMLIDLRDGNEREKHGVIPGSVHAPYPDLDANLGPGGLLHELAAASKKRMVFYCAFGERSAMAVQAARDAGIADACHVKGGIDAWKKIDGPLEMGAPSA